MNGSSTILVLFNTIAITAIVMNVFFFIRAFYRFRDWRTGNKIAFWSFLALVFASIGILLFNISYFPILIRTASDPWFNTVDILIPLSMYLSLGAIGLWTIFMFFQWRETQ
ncbi:MAG: hypothetical protein ACTSYB_17380 [Candidatus Helarchaeota archaeon]